jgi:hypothetical protein
MDNARRETMNHGLGENRVKGIHSGRKLKKTHLAGVSHIASKSARIENDGASEKTCWRDSDTSRT